MDAANFTECFKVALQDEEIRSGFQKALEPLLNQKLKTLTQKLEKQNKTIEKLQQTVDELKKSFSGRKMGVMVVGLDESPPRREEQPKEELSDGSEKGKKAKSSKKNKKDAEEGAEVKTVAPRPYILKDQLPGKLDQYLWVYFDLETTSLERTSDITQIACICGDKVFSQYVLPKQPITKRASEMTQLTCKEGKLYHRDVEVPTVDAKTALQKLILFLNSAGKKIILIGHNLRRFDCRVLMHALNDHDLYDAFQEAVAGFVDTLPVMEVVRPGLAKYKQEYLVETILEQKYDAHDATADVAALQALLQKVNPSEEVITSFSFTCDSFKETLSFLDVKRENRKTLGPLINSKTISHYMADKIAAAGFSLTDLQAAHSQGPEGIHTIFTTEVENKPKVTKSAKIIEAVTKYFDENPDCV